MEGHEGMDCRGGADAGNRYSGVGGGVGAAAAPI